MKPIYFTLIFLLNFTNVFPQYTLIPDECFETRLIEQGIDSEALLDGQVLTNDIISVEILDLSNSDRMCEIYDLTGIEDFVSLKHFYCNDNYLTNTLDLSSNILLEEVICNTNYLTEINLSNLSNLKNLSCYQNQIAELDISDNINLERIDAPWNQLEYLDTSNNTNLVFLSVAVNNISEIQFTQNNLIEILLIGDNPLNSITINNLIKLKTIYCGGTYISNIDFSNNPNLEIIRSQNNEYLEFINLRNGANEIITRFDTTGSTNLSCVYVDDTNYSTINWTEIEPNTHFVETQQECDNLPVDEYNTEDSIGVFPNPANEFVSVIGNGIVQVEIYNSVGEKILSSECFEHIDVRKFSSGIYFVKIIRDKNNINFLKLIIE